MNKYVCTLRRGHKITDSDGNIIRNDWAEYEKEPDHVKPLEGELTLEYDNGIPRLKIGDGINEFTALPYMSVDSFILPKPIYINLKKNDWTQDADNRWYQDVVVFNARITPSSKIDLQPDPELLCAFNQKDLAFVAENDNGRVRVYCVGQVPLDEDDPDGYYSIQATITEVLVDG